MHAWTLVAALLITQALVAVARRVVSPRAWARCCAWLRFRRHCRWDMRHFVRRMALVPTAQPQGIDVGPEAVNAALLFHGRLDGLPGWYHAPARNDMLAWPPHARIHAYRTVGLSDSAPHVVANLRDATPALLANLEAALPAASVQLVDMRGCTCCNRTCFINAAMWYAVLNALQVSPHARFLWSLNDSWTKSEPPLVFRRFWESDAEDDTDDVAQAEEDAIHHIVRHLCVTLLPTCIPPPSAPTILDTLRHEDGIDADAAWSTLHAVHRRAVIVRTIVAAMAQVGFEPLPLPRTARFVGQPADAFVAGINVPVAHATAAAPRWLDAWSLDEARTAADAWVTTPACSGEQHSRSLSFEQLWAWGDVRASRPEAFRVGSSASAAGRDPFGDQVRDACVPFRWAPAVLQSGAPPHLVALRHSVHSDHKSHGNGDTPSAGAVPSVV